MASNNETSSNKSAYYYIVFGLIFLICLTTLITIGGRVFSDGYNYYAYLRSAVIDADLDFRNDFQNYGSAFWRTYKPQSTVTGYFTNVFSIGPALLWAPFYLVAHLGVTLFNIAGGAVTADGFSEPYQLSVAIGSQFYAFLGIILLFRLIRKIYPIGIAFVSTLVMLLGTFLIYYIIFEPSMSHPLSFFAVTLFVYLWYRSRPSRKTIDWIWLGLAAGLMMLVRWQNGIFMALPGIEALYFYYGALKNHELPKVKILFKGHIVFLGAAFIAFIPQMIVWKIIYGGFLTIPQGSSFMKWDAPFMVETLFSSRHGLFSWHPVLLAGALGWAFLWKRDRLLTIATLFLFTLMTYVNSVVFDWWAGWSFGMRRFDGFLPFLGLGLAGTLTFLVEFIKKRPLAVVTFLLSFFIIGNFLFMNQFRGRVIHQGGVVSFERVFKNMVDQVYARTGNPFSLPANLIFAAQYDEFPSRYDSLVGIYVDDKNFYGNRMDLGTQQFYLGKGWNPANKSWQGQFDYLVSNQTTPVIYMPLRSTRDYSIVLHIAPFTIEGYALAKRETQLEIQVNGKNVGILDLAGEWQEYTIPVSADLLRYGLNTMEFKLKAVTVGNTDYDSVVLGMDYIEFKPLQ